MHGGITFSKNVTPHRDPPVNGELQQRQGHVCVSAVYPSNRAPISTPCLLLLYLLDKKPAMKAALEGSGMGASELLTKRGVPCLSIHDSAIVPARYDAELQAAMLEKFKQSFGCKIRIK